MSFSIVFPGQGSQVIGMMAELAEQHGLVKDLFVQASDILSVDLWSMSQEGPIEALSQTQNTQPALLVAGVAAWKVWQKLGGTQPQIMAGHSLGEYTALVCAGALSFSDGVSLVRDRGRYMQEAVPEGKGGMAAILGLDDDVVRQVCRAAAEGDVLQAVNFNAPGQVVIAGTVDAIERGILQLKEAGAKRALPLPVSIPAHSSLMSPASERLEKRLESINMQMPSIPVLHNCNVEVAMNADEISKNLVTQLDSPVRWVESIEKIHQQGIDNFVESGPGRVLGGMVKRIVKGVNVGCIDKPTTISELISSVS